MNGKTKAPQMARECQPDRSADDTNVETLSDLIGRRTLVHVTSCPHDVCRARLHLRAGGVDIVVTITMMTTAEKIPSSTMG